MKQFYKTSIHLVCVFFLISFQVNAQCSFTTTTPYFEGFESLTSNNQLPTCWAASNLGGSCGTYTATNTLSRFACSGNRFAAFCYTPNLVSYFYTNGVLLNAGATYSAAVWYHTDSFGNTNWTDLSLLVGASQSTTGLVSVASTNTSNLVSPVCKLVSNTFTVGTSGIYYVAVRATNNGSCCAQYLSWDDLSIQQVSSNCTIAVTASPNPVCQGKTVTLTATGATSYTWSNGATTSSIVVTPNSNTNYTVFGINSISSCTATAAATIAVNPVPLVALFAPSPNVCSGNSVTINAFGASSYTIVPSPSVPITSPTTYSVIGSNQFGCSSTATAVINVFPNPTISLVPSPSLICAGETLTLNASGGNTYLWTLAAGNATGNAIPVSPTVTTVYAVQGFSSITGCSANASITVNVDACLGIENENVRSNCQIFPNPAKDKVYVTSVNKIKNISVLDICGRVITWVNVEDYVFEFKTESLHKGIYFLKIQTDVGIQETKIIIH